MAVIRILIFITCLGFIGCFFPTRRTTPQWDAVAWRLQQQHLEQMKKDKEYYGEQEQAKAREQLTDPQEK